MINVVLSRSGTSVRLTDERWSHIVEEHSELAGLRYDVLEVLASPERILAGGSGEQLAIREYEAGKWLVVVYKELQEDGFVITAFLTRRVASLNQRRQLWPQ